MLPPMIDRRAVLLEAEPATASVLAEWLVEAGWSVDRAASVDAVEPLLGAATLLVATSDTQGIQLFAKVRQTGRPIRLVGVGGDAALRQAAKATGADAVLELPLSHAAMIEAIEAAPTIDRSRHTEVVRVPQATSLTQTAGMLPPETGPLEPGWLLPHLQRWAREHRTAVLEVRAADGRFARLFLDRGVPAAVRMLDPETAIGALIVRLGALLPGRLPELLDAGRASGRRLGQVLLTEGVVDRALMERVLRVQVLERAALLGRIDAGTWALVEAEPIGIAAYDVPVAAVAWALTAWRPPLTAGLALCYARLDLPPHHWHLFDPSGALAAVPMMLAVGSRLGEVAEAVGGDASALLRFFVDQGVAVVSGRPFNARPRITPMSTSEVAARLMVSWRLFADADLYVVIGVSPSAPDDEVQAAVAASLVLTRPEDLPADLGAEDRRRAAEIHARVVEAGKVLGNPLRRAEYDAMLAKQAPLPRGDMPTDAALDLRAARARAFMHAGAWVSAASLLSPASRISSAAPDLLAMLGEARRRACPDDPSAGEAELRMALQADANLPFACVSLARLLGARGERDAARTWARRACLANPEDSDARTLLDELTR